MEKLCLVSQWDLTSAFPSGCIKRFPDTGMFKCRKWHSSWVLCHEGSAYDLSEHRQDFLSLPRWLLGWANSWPAHSPPITWAAKPPPLSAEGSHTTCSWLLKQVFLMKSLWVITLPFMTAGVRDWVRGAEISLAEVVLNQVSDEVYCWEK